MNHNNDYEIVGESKHIKDVLRKIDTIAPFDTAVLITGETGTGKELVANQIHLKSRRKSGRLIAINCSTVTRDLAESELFGHERGAFTGAITNRPGAFELADKSTLFLDEVSTMQPDIQSKFLRVLETGRFRHLGGINDIQVDVRVIGATNNPDLYHDTNFRGDIYYRLAAYVIHLLPLKERPGDIRPIAQSYMRRWSKKNGYERILTPEAFSVLELYDYPGNVRELQYILERAAIEAEGELISPDLLMEKIEEQRRQQGKYQKPQQSMLDIQIYSDGFITDIKFPWDMNRARYAVVREQLKAALRSTHGNVTEAVHMLGIGRNAFYTRAQRCGLKIGLYRSRGVDKPEDLEASHPDLSAGTISSPFEAMLTDPAQTNGQRNTPQESAGTSTIDPKIEPWVTALKKYAGNFSKAAKKLGVPEGSINCRLKQLGYSRRGFYEAFGIEYKRRQRKSTEAVEEPAHTDIQSSNRSGQKPTETYAAQAGNKKYPGLWDDMGKYMETRMAEALRSNNGDQKLAAKQLKVSQHEFRMVIEKDMGYDSVREFYRAHNIPYGGEARKSAGKSSRVVEFHRRR